MATLSTKALLLSLILCVTFSCSKSSELLDKRQKRDWSLQGMIQNILNSIDGDSETTTETTNVTTPTIFSTNSTTSSPMSSTTSLVTMSSSSTPTAKLVNFTSSSTSFSSSSSVSSTTPWTSTTEDPKCRTDKSLETVCNVSEVLIGEDFWDVYYVMFSDDVIRALLFGCSSGHWCLEDKYYFWDALMMERAERVLYSPLFRAVCEMNSLTCLHDFVNNFTECKLYQRMQLAMESVDMLCKLQKEPTTTPECVQHVLAALHVTIVDILRDQNQKESNEDDGNACLRPEAQITRTFLCLELKCPGNVAVLTSFEPWKWFVSDIADISMQCSYRNDVCQDDTNFTASSSDSSSSSSSSSSLSSSQTSQSHTSGSSSTGAWTDFGHVIGDEPFGDLNEDGSALEHNQEEEDEWENAYDANMLLGMAVTSLVLLSVMVVSFCLWWRKLHRDRVVKAGYTQLRCDEA